MSSLTCPSSRCADGAILLGIVRRDGRVAFTSGMVRVDAEFVRIARQGRKPEARFRFAGPCHRGACQQWTGERCGVIDLALEQVAKAGVHDGAALPDCSIRSSCRWFAQAGSAACATCADIITEADRDPESR